MKNGSYRLLFFIVLALAVRVAVSVFTPVFDTSEARYAAISANMARTGDFTVPRFTYKGVYRSFDGKPPLLFQAGGVCCKVLGVNEFAVRLPVLAASLVLLALLWSVVRVLADGDRRAAWLAVGVAVSATAYYALAGFCMTDGMLVTCVAGAILCHAALVKTGDRNWSLGVAALLGVGMIVKGPVAVVEFGLPVFLDTVVNRRWAVLGRYRWFSGSALFLLVAAPWFVLRAAEDRDFLYYFFVNENLLRFLVHDYGDRYGAGRETFRGMAAVWLLVVTLPWSPLVLRRFWQARGKGWTWRSAAPSSVLGWGVAGITAFWCLTSRVPIAYLVPAVPLFAGWSVLTADAGRRRSAERIFPFFAGATMLVLIAVLAVTALFSDKMPGAAAPYHPRRYSYEFYHASGVPGEAAE